MRAYVARKQGGIESLELIEREVPGALLPGQIRIAMRAASLNFRDLLILGGAVGKAGESDFIPCSDGAGEVVDAASDVWRVKVGDRVALTFSPDWMGGPWEPTPSAGGRGGAIPGVMRDEVVVGQHEAVLLPQHLSWAEGATLPCAGVTAWHALCGTGTLLPGMTVLTQGGGGVSVFALQFAKLFGARVFSTSSSDERCVQLKGLGADEAINYAAEGEWDKRVRALTGGHGVDVTIDVGGAQTVARSLASTRRDGRVVLVGMLTGMPAAVNPFAAGVTICPAMVGSRQDFEAMTRAIAAHQLRPVIGHRFKFEQLPEALRQLKQGRHLGKIVVEF